MAIIDDDELAAAYRRIKQFDRSLQKIKRKMALPDSDQKQHERSIDVLSHIKAEIEAEITEYENK